MLIIINLYTQVPRISQPQPTCKYIYLWPHVYQYISEKKEKYVAELRKENNSGKSLEKCLKNESKNGAEKPDNFGNTFRMNSDTDSVDTP